MKLKALILILLCSFCKLLSQETQLAPPIPSIIRSFVNKKIDLSYDFRMEGSTIEYTVNQDKRTKKYIKPIQLNKSMSVVAKVTHPHFKSSTAIESHFYKHPKSRVEIVGTEPNPSYKSKGFSTLTDRVLGNENFKENYLGYNIETIELAIKPLSSKKIKTINISFLVNQGAWIFGPEKIEILQNENIIYKSNTTESTNPISSKNIIQSIKLNLKNNDPLTLRIKPVVKLPAWHDGKGNLAWVFIDEIWID